MSKLVLKVSEKKLANAMFQTEVEEDFNWKECFSELQKNVQKIYDFIDEHDDEISNIEDAPTATELYQLGDVANLLGVLKKEIKKER